MRILEKLKELLGLKPPEIKGKYMLKDFSRASKNFCVGGEDLTQVWVFDKNKNFVKPVIPFKEKLNYLQFEKQIPLIDKTVERMIPKECKEKPTVVKEL